MQNLVNVFDYVKFLLAHKKEVNKEPQKYLPWPYKGEGKFPHGVRILSLYFFQKY